MSTETGHKTGLGERIKFALIPVLVLILGAVLFWPSGNSSADPLPSLAEPAISSQTKVPTNTSDDAKPKFVWPDCSLEEVIVFSPFDPLPTTGEGKSTPSTAGLANTTMEGEKQAAADKPAMKTLKAGPLQAVYHDGRDTVALINSRVVRPGDFLEEGMRIVEITQEGVTVEVQ